MFLEEKGYNIKENKIFQDPNSAVLMKPNGRISFNEKSQYISVHYFFIKGRIYKGEVNV